jgi:hypothetical protein
VAAVGVRLGEAPDAPSWGEVHICIPSGQRSIRRQRAALRSTHPSGDDLTLRAPSSILVWVAHAAIGRMATARGVAVSKTTDLIDQDGGDSGSRVADSEVRSRLGDPASWKDPL